MAKKLFKCWRQKFKLAMLLTFMINLSVLAQDNYSLTGVVMLESLAQPASGVSVIIKGTDTGTVTDFDGNYIIEVKTGDVLEFVYLGFKTELVTIVGQATANVSMKDDTEKLEEIVVVGYGTQKEKNITSAVSKVGGEVIENRAVARAEDALRGRVAGLRIRTSTSEAGGDPRITLRGPGSVTGTSSPLIVVDGIALGTDPSLLADIDNNNIESISVLKDASSVAIYGSRGANGVVLVTLKEGKPGDTKFSFNSYFGYRYANKNDNFNDSVAEERSRLLDFRPSIDALDPTDVDAIRVTDGYFDALTELETYDFLNSLDGGEENLQDIIFPGGYTTSHSFSARGGDELTKFNASVSYLNDEGIALVDEFTRYNGSVKIDSKSKNNKFRFGVSVRGSYVDQERLPARFTDPLRQPYLPVFFNEDLLEYSNPDARNDPIFDRIANGNYTFSRAFDGVFIQDPDNLGSLLIDPATGLPATTLNGFAGDEVSLGVTGNVGPIPTLLERRQNRRRTFVNGTAYLEYKLAKGLKLRQTFSGNSRNSTSTNSQFFNGQERVSDTERIVIRDERLQYTTESLLTYKRDVRKHSFDNIIGFEFNEWNYYNQESGASGFGDDFTNNIPLSAVGTTFTQNGSEKLASYFGRVNYGYDDRYLVSLSARADGSSRFGDDNRFGFFPAASVGWNVSNERFLSNSGLLRQLKLRASYGVSGSNDIDNNIFNELFRSQETFSPVSAGAGAQGVKSVSIPNSDLQWERLIEFNPGIDIGIGNGLLDLTVDYYTRTSEDLILNAPVSTTLGATTFLQNIGEVENEGFEIEARSRIISKPNFSWNVSGQFSLNRNEVKSLGTSSQIISAIDQSSRPTEFIARVGQPITSFYGFVVDREVDFTQVINPFNRFNNDFANVFVKDLNNDGIIDDEDRTELGNPYPDFEWGFNSDFKFADFDVSLALQGSHGAEVRVADLDQLLFASESNVNLATTVDDNTQNFTRHRRFTDDHIQDASFVALRNVTLGYTIPSQHLAKLNIDRIRFYVSGENLVYVFADDYDGFNPEATGQTSNNANTALTDGYQRGDGPVVRTVTLGFNLDF